MLFLFLFSVLLLSGCQKEGEAPPPNVNVKELVGERGCPYCHDMRRKLLGPSFYEISERYSEKDKEKLVESILKGSKGKWGNYEMPPQKVSRQEAELIAEWILSLKEKR